jgi:2',3'-cyclic-nucleotide 2'-phosphodiesterase (5'-nucleotidase family)
MKFLFAWIFAAWAGLAQAVPLRILATGDMHGWLRGVSVPGGTLGGAAETLAQWRQEEGYRGGDFLVLSAGDVATGPAVSTAYRGLPAVEAMNAMGYDASALGNHELDFGMDGLAALRAKAAFPFLSANVFQGNSKNLLLEPYAIVEKGGLKIGILGLTTSELAQAAASGKLRAGGYAEAVRRWAPRARAEGAQVLIVLAHVPLDELEAAAAQLGDLDIPLMLGGHSHELAQRREPKSGTWIVNSGEWWRAYSRIDMDVNTVTGKALVLSSRQSWVRGNREPDSKVKKLVDAWQARLEADPAYSRALGFLAAPLPRFWPASNFVCDAWLAMDPKSDVALNNDGAMRQDLEAGALTRAKLTSLLPFSDGLLRVQLSGAELLEILPGEGERMGLGGIRREGGGYRLMKTGKALEPAARYQVLVNSFMAATMPKLKKAALGAANVADDWRDPLEAWLRKHPSGAASPLDALIDAKPRL